MHQQRKLDHLRICLEEDVQSQNLPGALEEYHFIHQALPEIDLADVQLSCRLLGKDLNAPLIISSMTASIFSCARSPPLTTFAIASLIMILFLLFFDSVRSRNK